MKSVRGHTKYVDPVCGMSVEPETAAARTRYNGVEIFFCAEGCKARFEADPQKYAAAQPKGFWGRYLERLNKATGGRPPSCCH